MSVVKFPPYRAFARLDLSALRRNFCLLRDLARQTSPHAHVIAVVKDNAYGHGLRHTVPALTAAGCRLFAVATAAEALAVRALAPKAGILVLGYTPPQIAPVLAAQHVAQTVISAPYGAALSAAMAGRGRLAVHIKLDGGMCRQGLDPHDRKALLATLALENLRPTGLYTHFPTADTDPTATRRSFAAFLACRRAAAKAGYPLFCHAAASAALLTCPETVADGVRPGLALYGIAPVPTRLPLRPVLSLHAPVIRLQRVPAGTPVGYGGDFVTARPSLVGTLPIGYGDGTARALQGLSVTLSHGDKRFSVPLIGRICMDHCMVDLTDTPACVGDTVCLFDSAAPIAARLHTIPYEVLTGIAPRVARLPQNPTR